MDLKKLTLRKISMVISAALLAVVFVTSCSKKDDDNVCVTCSASVSQGTGNAGNVTTSSMENCGSSADVATAEANFRSQNSGSTITCTRK